MMQIDVSTLRLAWAAIESMQSKQLLALTDTGLVKMILQQVSRQMLLNGEEVCALYDYISSRTALIRDLADARCA